MSKSFEDTSFLSEQYFKALFNTGGIGVHIFFVISGFLITYLLLREKEQNGTISVKNFYIRRVLRIWPLYYLVMLSGMYLLPQLANTFQFCGTPWLSLTFLNNFDLGGACYSPHTGIAWSVAIEEQFYLVWPLVFLLCMRSTKLLAGVSLLGYLGSCTFILMNPGDYGFHTLGNVNYLMAGCFGASLFHSAQQQLTNSTYFKPLTAVIVIGIMIYLIIYKQAASHFILPFTYLYLIYYAVINDGADESQSIFSKWGKYTYGMYMYHHIFIMAFKIMYEYNGIPYKEDWLLRFSLFAICLALSIGVSILSYEYFEKYILKYKGKFASVKTRV